MTKLHEAVCGCMIGTMVGDAIGLPMEGLSPKRIKSMYPNVRQHYFFFGHGMVSDDTEHTIMLARALIKAKGNIEVFTHSFAWHLRFWFLSLPAGLGMATLRSCLKLLIGVPPAHSGVFSAGNAPSMRGALLGLYPSLSHEELCHWVAAQTTITHSDPKAFYGALAIALAARHGISHEQCSASGYLEELRTILSSYNAKELIDLLEKAILQCHTESPENYLRAMELPKGISGYTYHTVPAVLFCFFRNCDDFESGIQEIIALGGDTDSTAAIVGALIGARVGEKNIPDHWKTKIIDWPHSKKALRKTARLLSDTFEDKELRTAMPSSAMLLALPRNLCFLTIVLGHGFRRLFPPYA